MTLDDLLVGRAPELAVAFATEAERNAARNFMNLIARAETS